MAEMVGIGPTASWFGINCTTIVHLHAYQKTRLLTGYE